MLLIKHFYRFIISILSLCLLTTASYAEPVLGNGTHLGTWVRSCSVMPGNDEQPLFSVTYAEIKEKDITLEINIFTDASCTTPWLILPEYLYEGHYTLGNVRKVDFADEKNVGALPLNIKLQSFNNHKALKGNIQFTAYQSGNSAYIPAQGEDFPYAMTLQRKVVKVRTAEEVYKKPNNSGRAGLSCIITPIDTRFSLSAQWCLDNMDFPEPRFREFCTSEKSEAWTNTFAKSCPERMVSYCEYGRKEYGYVIRRYYTTEHFKLFPNIEQHCKRIFNGTWFDKKNPKQGAGIKIK